MANRRESSEFVKALGALMEFWQAIVFAVFNLGGNDSDLRRVFKVEGIADKIARLIMGESRLVEQRPKPDTTGLEVFTLEVDGDFNWFQHTFYPGNCHRQARASDFIMRSGRRVRTFALYPSYYFAHKPSNEELLADFKSRNLQQPCLAGTNAVIEARKNEIGKRAIVGVCGVVQVDIEGGSVVGCVYQGAGDRELHLLRLDDDWRSDFRFLAEVIE